MSKKTKLGKLAGVSILSAIAASLCCITPVLAFVSGVGSVASTFLWLEPARPYLLGITILVLAFAWSQKLKPRTIEEIQCDCGENDKKPFIQTKRFLGIITLFAFLMMGFPYYGQIIFPKPNKEIVVVSSNKKQEVKFNVSGMTCASCEKPVEHAVNKLPGIISVSAISGEGIVDVVYDNSKINKVDIKKAIDATGYKVSGD